MSERKLTTDEILLYLTNKAPPDVKEIADELSKDPKSKVSKMIQEWQRRMRQKVDIDKIFRNILSPEPPENTGEIHTMPNDLDEPLAGL
jgi:hypothetical protein